MTLSLRTWLALGLVLATAVPLAAGAGAWVAAGQLQAGREQARSKAAVAAVAAGSVETAAQRKALRERLGRLGVEAQLAPGFEKPSVFNTTKPIDVATSPDFADKAKEAKLAAVKRQLTTPGLNAFMQAPDAKSRVDAEFATVSVEGPAVSGTLFVRRESATARWAIALGVAALGLAAALALAVTFLSRWVLRPLASLASDADRIAGGELTATPAPTRAREVAQVGDALHGMAGALGEALGTSAAAEEERRFLISAIAHDLRTPLFTLRGSLEAIEHGLGGEDALGRAQRKADHLDRLVGDLFAFARADYSHAGERLDLAEVARGAAEAVDPRGKTVVVAAGDPVYAHGDPVALQRAITNLVENAVRHARTRVQVTVQPGRIEVSDDGPGFAPADLEHVFEPLFRGDRARSAATGGAGLGLAIARRLARAHDGEVEAANAPAGGALVTLRLP